VVKDRPIMSAEYRLLLLQNSPTLQRVLSVIAKLLVTLVNIAFLKAQLNNVVVC